MSFLLFGSIWFSNNLYAVSHMRAFIDVPIESIPNHQIQCVRFGVQAHPRVVIQIVSYGKLNVIYSERQSGNVYSWVWHYLCMLRSINPMYDCITRVSIRV